MGKPTGFMEIERKVDSEVAPLERLKNWKEFKQKSDEDMRRSQGARCMDCGVPFCQSENGCPVYNLIPEWNDLVYNGRWESEKVAADG